MQNSINYVYLYLDPTKPGIYNYGKYVTLYYEPFYVGKGQGKRKEDHLEAAKKGKSTGNRHLYFKIKKILIQGLEPIIKIAGRWDEAKIAFNYEKHLIKLIGRTDKKTGVLTNMTNGGDGAINPSVETRKKISNSLKGNIPWNKGKTGIYSKKTRDNISKTLTGRKGIPLTDYQKECISKVHKGKVVSKETRQKQSLAHLGHTPWNKGTKGICKAWNKGLCKQNSY
jgi:hypothetical protein